MLYACLSVSRFCPVPFVPKLAKSANQFAKNFLSKAFRDHLEVIILRFSELFQILCLLKEFFAYSIVGTFRWFENEWSNPFIFIVPWWFVNCANIFISSLKLFKYLNYLLFRINEWLIVVIESYLCIYKFLHISNHPGTLGMNGLI